MSIFTPNRAIMDDVMEKIEAIFTESESLKVQKVMIG